MKKTVIPAKIIDVKPNNSIVNEESLKIEKVKELNEIKKENFKKIKDDEIYKKISFWKYITITLGFFVSEFFGTI